MNISRRQVIILGVIVAVAAAGTLAYFYKKGKSTKATVTTLK